MTDAVTQAREATDLRRATVLAMQHMVRVRESRAADDQNPAPSIVAWDAVFACIDAELAALLAAERQRVVGMVEGMKRRSSLPKSVAGEIYDDGFDTALSQLAARLTETEG